MPTFLALPTALGGGDIRFPGGGTGGSGGNGGAVGERVVAAAAAGVESCFSSTDQRTVRVGDVVGCCSGARSRSSWRGLGSRFELDVAESDEPGRRDIAIGGWT